MPASCLSCRNMEPLSLACSGRVRLGFVFPRDIMLTSSASSRSSLTVSRSGAPQPSMKTTATSSSRGGPHEGMPRCTRTAWMRGSITRLLCSVVTFAVGDSPTTVVDDERENTTNPHADGDVASTGFLCASAPTPSTLMRTRCGSSSELSVEGSSSSSPSHQHG